MPSIILRLYLAMAVLSAAASGAEPFPLRGYYLTMMRMPVMGLPEWKDALDCFAEDGANVVILWTAGGFRSRKFPVTWQHNADHANVREDFVPALIDYAHTKGIRVLLGFTPFAYDGVNRFALEHPELKARKRDGSPVDEFGIHCRGWNLCPTQTESQRLMREYAHEMAFEFYSGADGVLVESSDYAICHCPQCGPHYYEREFAFVRAFSEDMWKRNPDATVLVYPHYFTGAKVPGLEGAVAARQPFDPRWGLFFTPHSAHFDDALIAKAKTSVFWSDATVLGNPQRVAEAARTARARGVTGFIPSMEAFSYVANGPDGGEPWISGRRQRPFGLDALGAGRMPYRALLPRVQRFSFSTFSAGPAVAFTEFERRLGAEIFGADSAAETIADLLELQRIWNHEGDWYWQSPLLEPEFFRARAARLQWPREKLADYDANLARLAQIAARHSNATHSATREMAQLAGTVVERWGGRRPADITSAPHTKIAPDDAALWLDFAQGDAGVRLANGAHWNDKRGALEFAGAAPFAEAGFSRKLDGIAACSIGGWFFPRRAGESAWLARGTMETGQNGERFFRRADDWVKLLLGTDQRGFFLGCINGNSRMPFPLVTLDEPRINEWHQLVAVKEARGGQRFYRNGTLVYCDEHSLWAGQAHPFCDVAGGEPLRLAMPQGGLIGEAWVIPREFSASEILRDWEAKRARFHPSHPATVVHLRDMNAHHAAGLWREPPSAANWPAERARIESAVRQLIGPMPPKIEPLDARDDAAPVDCGSYERRKVSFTVQPGDRMPAWLLVPKSALRTPHSALKSPAVICMYGTTSGAGKDTTVGLSGGKPGTPPERNRAFALDFAEAGFVVLAPDFLRDGERTPPCGRPYDTTDFYARFPDWSCVGKDVWDTQRALDYLQSLPFVAAERIGMCGHSYGGHTTIFATALEPRIACVFASGPVSDFVHHGAHWAVGRKPPVSFYEWTALIAPRPLWVQQAAGERRPMEEENHAAVAAVYRALGSSERVKCMWQAGDHDFPPAAREAAVAWMRQWLDAP